MYTDLLCKYTNNMAKLIKKKRIIVPLDKISILMARFDCKRAAVYNALGYRSQSDMAKNIRKMALNEFDGRNITESTFKES